MKTPSDNIWSKLPEFDPSPDLWNRIDADLGFEAVSKKINQLPEFSPKANVWDGIRKRLFFRSIYKFFYFGLFIIAVLYFIISAKKLNVSDKIPSDNINVKNSKYIVIDKTKDQSNASTQNNNTDIGPKDEYINTVSKPDDFDPFKGLIAWYPFNASANDLSGNLNNGTVHDAIFTYDRFGNPNSACYFNGYDSYIEVPDSPSLNPVNAISICAWYKPEAFSNDGSSGIVDKGFTSFVPPYYQYRLASPGEYSTETYDMFSFSITTNNKSKGFNTPNYYYSTGIWYFIVGTFDGNTMNFYVNNKLIQTRKLKATLNTYKSSLFIGRNSVDTTGYLKGSVDDIRIYNRALTASEAEKLYNETPSNGIKGHFLSDIIKLNIKQDYLRHKLIIETNSDVKQNLEIINKKGQQIFNSVISSKAEIDVSGIPKGVYKVKLFTDKEMHVEMLVKQ